MAEIRSAEAQRIVQRLLKQLEDSQTLKTTTSTNALKKIRRGLGALLFSPDYIGYIDVIDDKMRKGESPKQILSSIASRSEKLVKSYSPLPGVFEAHHIIALNSLRDSFMGLPVDQQDKFLKMLADEGWEIGDSPKQLMDTVLTRMAHVGQGIKEPTKSEIGTTVGNLKETTQGIKGYKEHAHVKRILAGNAETAEDLITIFNKKIAPESIKAAKTGIVQDANLRAYLQTQGYPVGELSREIVESFYSDPVRTQGFLQTLNDGLLEFSGPVGEGVVDNLIQQGDEAAAATGKVVSSAEEVSNFSRFMSSIGGLTEGAHDAARVILNSKKARIAGAVALPGVVMLPLSAHGHQQAREAREKDPSLRNKAVEFFTGMQVAGDAMDATGTAMAATGGAASLTGAGAIPGIPTAVAGVATAATGGLISNIGALGEFAIYGAEAVKNMDLSGIKGPFQGLKQEAQEELPQPIENVDGQVYNPLAPSI
tara:strand:- start:47 stop:1492 length:1446 start_codon:yes stop_codon:yes gene_type:complete